jgi:hypothetical protein
MENMNIIQMSTGKGKTTKIVQRAWEEGDSLIISREETPEGLALMAHRLHSQGNLRPMRGTGVTCIRVGNVDQMMLKVLSAERGNVFIDGFKLDRENLDILAKIERDTGAKITVTVQINPGFKDSEKTYDELFS